MEEIDNITLLAQVVMEDHEILMEDHVTLMEVRDTLTEHTNTLSTVVETLGRIERKLDAVTTLSMRHEKWITKTAPVVAVRYPTRP